MRGRGTGTMNRPASALILRLLTAHLLRVVPREHQYVVRLPLQQRLRRQDRDAGSGDPLALLVRIAVDHEVNGVDVYARGVQQGGPLRGGPVGRDAAAVGLESGQQRAQIVLHLRHARPEGQVGPQLGEPEVALVLQVLRSTLSQRCRPRAGPAQGPALQGREELDVVEMEPVSTDQPVHRMAGVVAIVLVVDRVELHVLDQPTDARVRHLQHAVVRKQTHQGRDEALQVGYMGHHVVREHHVRRAVLGAYAGRDVSVEELHEGRDAAVLRHLRRAGGGSMPSTLVPFCRRWRSR